MKLRRGFVVVGLVAVMLGASAQPARAAYRDWTDVVMRHGVVGLLIIEFYIQASYGPYDVADGFVRAADDPQMTQCQENVPVKVQYKTAAGWKTVDSGKSNGNAQFQATVKDKAGKYRMLAPGYTSAGGYVCYKDTSTPKTHRH